MVLSNHPEQCGGSANLRELLAGEVRGFQIVVNE